MPHPRHEAVYRLRCSDAETAHALREAIVVEADDALGGAEVQIVAGLDPATLEVQIRAVDLVHLRAATNSYLKWLAAAEATLAAARTPGEPGGRLTRP